MSLCFAKAEPDPQIYACLLLKAVFPAFEELFNAVPVARDGMEQACFSIRLQTSSGLRSTLSFERGHCRYLGEEKVPADIVLHFLTDKMVSQHRNGARFASPFPIRGITLWRQIRGFSRLSKLLERYLDDSPAEGDADVLCAATQAWLTLGVCLRAAVQLSRHENFSRKYAATLPQGYAEFGLAGANGRRGWILSRDGKLSAGDGAAPEDPRVRVLFPDAQTALDAINDRLDLVAAVGQGQVHIDGYLPLADALGVLFERVPGYLKT